MGQKLGMTRVFVDEDGSSICCTAVYVGGNYVAQVKTTNVDGYSALQLVFGDAKRSRVNKALRGHFAKASVEAGRWLSEFKFDQEYALGDEINIFSLVNAGDVVDITSKSKGKGFAGTIKRHNFRSGSASHGNSRAHNLPGSIGQREEHVFRGKKMAGRLGNKIVTTKNLKIVRLYPEKSIILIAGSVAGEDSTLLKIRSHCA